VSLVRRGIAQGLAPIVCGALLACANPPDGPDAHANWLTKPPSGCAVGFSGPTLNPGDAIRRARTHSLENLAAETLGIEVRSELRLSESGSSEITEQAIIGIIQQSRIVAMTSIEEPDGIGELREVYALACPNERRTSDIHHSELPDWILNVPRESDRLCATGIGGPTWYPQRQRQAAIRDARSALALAIESRIETRTLDSGRGLAHVSSSSASTERARDRANTVETLEAEWLDPDGRGPLGLEGVLYGLACVAAR